MDKAKKKRIKKYVAWISLAALVALLAVMPLLARNGAEEDGPQASILSGTVQMGSVETGLRGGGTLTADTSMDVELPSGVKITEFLARNGDTVSEGDPVAAVDKVSVMTAIVQVRDTLEYIQEEMDDAKDDTAASTVKATAGGRVKQVYAQPGDSVQDVMLRHGALAVLSLDGLMAVDLNVNTALAAGDTVRVVFQDDTQVSGRVESNLDGVLSVTVEDRSYPVDTAVEVTDASGTSLGRGTLYIHNAWKATAFTGTVSTVSARENTEISSGSTLFTLTDTDFSGTLDALASLHREYEQLLQELFAMYESGVLTAPCAGQISGVDEDSEFLLAAEQTGWTVRLLSGGGEECTGGEDCQAQSHGSGCAYYCTGLPDCANANHKTGCQGVCTGVGETCLSTRTHEYHEKTCVKRCICDLEENPATSCDASVHQQACIENCTGTEECPALTHKEGCWFHGVSYSAVAARVELVSLEGLWVVWGSAVYEVSPGEGGWILVEPAELQVIAGETAKESVEVAQPQDYAAGDIILLVTGVNSSGQTVYREVSLYQKAETENTQGGFPGNMSGMGAMSGMTGMVFPGGTTQAGTELYDLSKSVLMRVTSQERMTLEITLDEQDIADVSVGQKAEVKVNPLKGQIFEAEVTQIGLFGTSSGGSSKFTVELTLPLSDEMLPGMSANAYIPLYTKMDILTIPVAALAEEGGKTLVYTAIDEKTGDLTAPVEVTVGLSDGETAEILSGLAAGDVYYYSYFDVLEVSTEAETSRFSF